MAQENDSGSRSSALAYKNIFDVIANRIPGFSPAIREHVDFYDELLPHVLMGDFTRYLSALCCGPAASQLQQSTQCREALNILETALNSPDPKLRELVAVSFVENLDPADESYPCVRSQLGPSLRTQLIEYEAMRAK